MTAADAPTHDVKASYNCNDDICSREEIIVLLIEGGYCSSSVSWSTILGVEYFLYEAA